MPAVRVSFATSAIEDLEGIKASCEEQGVQGAGDRLIAETFERIEGLGDHADRGHVVPEFGQTFLRELIHPPSRIVYRRDADQVMVVRVWRSEGLLRLEADDGDRR